MCDSQQYSPFIHGRDNSILTKEADFGEEPISNIYASKNIKHSKNNGNKLRDYYQSQLLWRESISALTCVEQKEEHSYGLILLKGNPRKVKAALW